MKLSLCMIVKNEEAALPKCLESVQNVVDEIVVLDTGSTDQTPEIAQLFGAKVNYFQWCDDVSAARNEALKYVTGDWVLVLDAEEMLTPKIAPQIREAINIDDYLLINLVRQEVGATQSPYSLVSRLFRYHPDISFRSPYHALVDDSIAAILNKENNWQVGYLPKVAILHTKSVNKEENNYVKAAATMAEFLTANPDDAYICSKLGALYVQMGNVNGGIELLNRGLNLVVGNKNSLDKKPSAWLKDVQLMKIKNSLDQDLPENNYGIVYELNYHLGIAHTSLKNYPLAISHYQAALKLPIYPLLKLGGYNNLGNLLKATGDLSGAKSAYETALKIDDSFVIGYYNLGMVCKTMGLFVEAIEAYNCAIFLNPDYAEAYQNLGVVLLKVGDVENSLAAFEYAIALHEKDNPQEAKRLCEGLQEMGFLGDSH